MHFIGNFMPPGRWRRREIFNRPDGTGRKTLNGMIPRILLIAAVALVSLAPSGTGAAESTAVDRDRDGTFVVGAVSSNPKRRIPLLEAFANYLAPKLKDLGVQRSAARVLPNNMEMVMALRNGSVDLTSETVFSALYYSEEAGADILLREWKKGISAYHTVFITRRDSPIRSIDDLRGKWVAFEDPGSTSGFLLPLSIILDHGLKVAEDRPIDTPLVDGVTYQFVLRVQIL